MNGTALLFQIYFADRPVRSGCHTGPPKNKQNSMEKLDSKYLFCCKNVH